MTFESHCIHTPIGPLTLVSAGGVLFAAGFCDDPGTMRADLARRFGEVEFETTDGGAVAHGVRAYFEGSLGALERIEADPGGSVFQRNVWHTLRRSVPAGSTIGYGELAGRVGRSQAVRAVGAAMAANPIPIVIPCHRVLRADGQLWRYGGGLERKRWLLQHEGALPAEPVLFR